MPLTALSYNPGGDNLQSMQRIEFFNSIKKNNEIVVKLRCCDKLMFDFHAISMKATKKRGYQIQQCNFFTQESKYGGEWEENTTVSDRFEEIRDLINDVNADLLPYFYYSFSFWFQWKKRAKTWMAVADCSLIFGRLGGKDKCYQRTSDSAINFRRQIQNKGARGENSLWWN